MPTFDELAEKLDQQATVHTEQAFVVKSLLLVFCILFMRITMALNEAPLAQVYIS